MKSVFIQNFKANICYNKLILYNIINYNSIIHININVNNNVYYIYIATEQIFIC